ncbi:uncharacterized protein F5147DRAFT_775430 [Suillus discolor]|uniref:Uncharacterized protein n=1 Tax=Suillus discolor TaxID=1912936 RepID=A0A9P7JSH6_9AGAM|nr:uncharacterized protein F5147DRAFT_775430 [Suillus discolor]KAG2105110.1 hypothetical protein F5147DRAFT_775430 [Suillus discolor]
MSEHSIVAGQTLSSQSQAAIEHIYSSGDRMKNDKPFKKRKQRKPSSAIVRHNLCFPSEDEEPGHEERTYNNPFMDCSSMAEYLDVLSVHDRWKDCQRLKTMDQQTADNFQPLDLGFSLADNDSMSDMHAQQGSDILDMQFPTLDDHDQSDGETLDLGFPPLDVSDPSSNTEYGTLEMGFDTYPVDDVPDIGNNIQPAENPLEMVGVSQPDPIGFVIQRAVGDLQMAMHRLEIDRAGIAMLPDETFARQRVLECIEELLLACRLISIAQLST